MILPSTAEAFQHNISHSRYINMTPGDVTAAEHSKDLMAADHGGTLALCTQGAEDAVETCRMAQRMLRAIPQFSLTSLLLQLKRPRGAAGLLFCRPRQTLV